MITLIVNGQSQTSNAATLGELLESLQLTQNAVAIEYNGSIVARSAFSQTLLQDGDRLEIVRFVGGG